MAPPYITSRFPSMCRIEYPLVPSQPDGYVVDNAVFLKPRISIQLPADTRDIFGILVQDQRTEAGSQITLSSSGPDARLMKVVGQDAGSNYMEETIRLNGTTPVTTVKTFAWILWVDAYFETVLNETPGGNIADGVSTTFATSFTPIPGTVTIYVDGIQQIATIDYNIVGGAITFTAPPADGAQILTNYLYAPVVGTDVTISGFGAIPAGTLQWLANPIIYRYEDLAFGGSADDPALSFIFDNADSETGHTFYVYFYNILDELSKLYTIPDCAGSPCTGQFGLPPPAFASDCLDVRSFGGVGDGIADDTAAMQAAEDQAGINAAKNLLASQTSQTALNIEARPTVFLNGWGSNAQAAAYEHGTDQNFNFFGVDPGTTDAYVNAGDAVDTNDTTAASTAYRHTHKYAGCIWSFGALPDNAGNIRRLNITSEVPVGQTKRSAGIWWSINGGITWRQLYNGPLRTKGLDTIVMFDGSWTADQIQVMAFTDSHDDMAHNVFDINMSIETTTTTPFTPLPTIVCIPNGLTVKVKPGTNLANNVFSNFCQTAGDIWGAVGVPSGVTTKVDGILILDPSAIDSLPVSDHIMAAILYNKCAGGIQGDSYHQSGFTPYPTNPTDNPDMTSMANLINANELGCRDTGIKVAGSGIIDGGAFQYKTTLFTSAKWVGSVAFYFLKADGAEISGVTLQNFAGNCAFVGHSEQVHIHDITVKNSFSFVLDALRHSEFNNNTFDSCPIGVDFQSFSASDQGLLHISLCQNLAVHDNTFSNNSFEQVGGTDFSYPCIFVGDISLLYEWGLITHGVLQANVNIYNNKFLNNKLKGPPTGSLGYFSACQIRIYGGWNDLGPMKGVSVVGNTIAACDGGGIVWRGICDSQISNNSCDVTGLLRDGGATPPIFIGAVFNDKDVGSPGDKIIGYNVQIINNTSTGQKIYTGDAAYASTGPAGSGVDGMINIAITLNNPGIDPAGNSIAGIDFNASISETPTGAVDGSNTSFGLAHAPTDKYHTAFEVISASGEDYLEGYANSDFALSGSTVTLAVPPPVGATVKCTYMY